MSGIRFEPRKAGPRAATFAPEDNPAGLIDADHPAVLARAAVCIRGEPDERSRAQAIFRFVRDGILLGWGFRYATPKASEVLRAGFGSPVAKTTLLVALLRAAGIRARPMFLRLHSGILHGFLAGPPRYLPHSYAEIVVAGRRTATDAHVPDPLLRAHAAERLRASGLLMGWGLHCEASRDWDGSADCFSLWVDNGTVPGLSSDRRALPFRDAAHYLGQPGPGTLGGGPHGWLGNIRLALAGRRLRQLRRELAQATAAARPMRLSSASCPGDSGSVSGPSTF
jgi:hypothetical protein